MFRHLPRLLFRVVPQMALLLRTLAPALRVRDPVVAVRGVVAFALLLQVRVAHLLLALGVLPDGSMERLFPLAQHLRFGCPRKEEQPNLRSLAGKQRPRACGRLGRRPHSLPPCVR